MSQHSSPSSSTQIPKGIVWAAVLLGVAAVLSASAVLLWVVRLPGAVSVGSQDSVLTTPVPGDTADNPNLPSGTGIAPSGALGTAGPDAPAVPGPGMEGAAPISEALVVQDWAGFADDDALQAALLINEGWANNDIVLALLPETASPHGPAGVAVGYQIAAEPPNDYVGFEWDIVPPQDWRGYGELVTWVRSTDASERQLVLQFHEWSGEVWRHRVLLKELPSDGEVRIPITADQWEWADWSERQNKELDLHEVTRMGIFVGHIGPGAGEMRLGSIQLRQ